MDTTNMDQITGSETAKDGVMTTTVFRAEFMIASCGGRSVTNMLSKLPYLSTAERENGG